MLEDIEVALATPSLVWHVAVRHSERPAASSVIVGVEVQLRADQASGQGEAGTLDIPSSGAAAREREPNIEAASGAGDGWGHHVDTDGSEPTETQILAMR